MHHALRVCACRFERAAVNRRFHRGVGESSTPSWSDIMAAKKGRKAAKKGGKKAAKKGGRKAAKKGGAKKAAKKRR
jgi:hypothetical protein